MMRAWIKRMIVGLLFGCGALSLYLIMRHYNIGVSTLRFYSEMFKNFVTHSYGLSVLIYMTGVTILCAMGFPLTVLLSMAAGYFFGWMGVLYAALSVTFGSVLLFGVARYVFGDPLQSHYSEKLGSINHNISKNGATYIFIMNLLPFTPTPLLAIGAGISEMSASSFFWSNLLGIIPQTILYVWAGTSYTSLSSHMPIQSSMIIVGGLIALVFAIVFFVMKKIHPF